MSLSMSLRQPVRLALLALVTVAFLLVGTVDTHAASTFTIKKLDSGGNVGKYPSIKLRDKKKPVIAYYDSSNDQVKMILCHNAVCDDRSDRLNVLSESMGDPGHALEINLNNDGNPVNVFSLNPQNSGATIMFMTCIDPDCEDEHEEEGNAILFPVVKPDFSLAMKDGKGTIAYTYSADTISIARCKNKTCSALQDENALIMSEALTGEKFSTPKDVNIAIGEDGKPVVTYVVTDGDTSQLRLIKCNDATCTGIDITVGTVTPVTLAETTSSKGIQYNALTLNSSGNPVVAYYDPALKKGLLVICADKGCSDTSEATFYTGGSKLGSLDLAMKKNNVPVVSYAQAKESDSSKYLLKLAACSTASCADVNTQTVDSDGNVGLYNTLTVNSDNKVVVVYYDGGNKDLKLARQQ